MIFLLSAVALILLSGCPNGALSGTGATADIAFTFQAGPGTLYWFTADCTIESRALTATETSSGTFTLSVLKGSVTPVLLYRPDAVEPEGAIWPVTTSLDRTGGFSSRMLWRLLTETDENCGPPEAVREWCCHFNWKRFTESVAAIEDPWSLDQQKILLAIAAGTFKLKDLKSASP